MNISRRRFLGTALAVAPAVILTPGLLMQVRKLWVPRNPYTKIVWPMGDRGIYVGEVRYFPYRLSDAELLRASANGGVLTLPLPATVGPVSFDFTDRQWQRLTFGVNG